MAEQQHINYLSRKFSDAMQTEQWHSIEMAEFSIFPTTLLSLCAGACG